MIEKELIRCSANKNTALRMYFSDSSFLDNDKCAVWSKSDIRREILSQLKILKLRNNNIQYHRLVYVKKTTFSLLEVLELSNDLINMLRHGIDVSIGYDCIAEKIDASLNYAISNDGTIMRSHAGHLNWKIGVNIRKYNELVNRYHEIRHESEIRGLTFHAIEYNKIAQGEASSNRLFYKLCERLC